MKKDSVVILVDHKNRDLMACALLAYHLKQRGITPYMEPLEAYRGCLAAHRPRLIVFNHLIAQHLVEYSQELHEMGVLTGVVINEGLCYDDEVRNYNAGKHHKGAHIDLLFCWNKLFKEAIERLGLDGNTQVEVVGPSRHDFYFKPWAQMFDTYPWPGKGRPKVLFCTNFGLAKFYSWPKSEAEKLFASWSKAIPVCQDYWGIVEAHHASQQKILGFVSAVAETGRFDVVLRPHPREDSAFYQEWHNGLPTETRQAVAMDSKTNITSLILACDVQIGCQNCNTTMESWLAEKPTITLILEKNPLLFNPDVINLSPQCESAGALPGLIEEQLAAPKQDRFVEGRKAHLAKWLASPSGTTNERMAEAIAQRLKDQASPDWNRMSWEDRRRGFKLLLLRAIGKHYNYKPLVKLRSRLLGGRFKLKAEIQDKSVTPADTKAALAQFEHHFGHLGASQK